MLKEHHLLTVQCSLKRNGTQEILKYNLNTYQSIFLTLGLLMQIKFGSQ